MAFQEQWREIFPDLFGSFLDVRPDSRKWKNAVGDIRAWVPGRR